MAQVGDQDQDESVAMQEEALTTASFTMTYSGHGSSGCTATSNIKGYEPTDAGTFPVFIFVTGTSMTWDGLIDENLIQYMSGQGFVAATVAYDNGSYPFACSTMTAKASCIYNSGSASSAVSKLCSRAKADCAGKGVYVSGFSQGANISSMAKNYTSNARAAFLMGNGDKASGINLSACLDKSHLTFTTSQLREVDGQSDAFFGSNQAGVQTQLQAVTGKSCAAGSYDCLSADGSGWYIVANTLVSDGKADHCYFYNAASSTCAASGFDAGWNTGSSVWQKSPDIAWLKSK